MRQGLITSLAEKDIVILVQLLPHKMMKGCCVLEVLHAVEAAVTQRCGVIYLSCEALVMPTEKLQTSTCGPT